MGRERKLGVIRAVLDAPFNRNASHFPRFNDAAGALKRISEGEIIAEITQALEPLSNVPHDQLKPFLDRGRETLNEVKGLTEYQDQKATRLLTIVTFISALSGALFARFADHYPIHDLLPEFGYSLSTLLVALTYALFGLFALTAASGALVVFHATRTRFKYPSPEPESAETRRTHPGSYLFYSDVIELRPQVWARAFLSAAQNESAPMSLDTELGLRYLKSYITESYLVAAKVADKLRYLQPAQDLLAFSVRMLIAWIVLFAITAIAVAPLR